MTARLSRWLDPYSRLAASVLTVRSLEHLMRALGWTEEPRLDRDALSRFDYMEDLNDRRLRDAEVIASACRNVGRTTVVEIGTGDGRTTALMARNAPDAVVHTVNIPPEEIDRGGRFTTGAPAVEAIGRVYREQRLANVRQILANSRDWEPDLESVDVAFIDGCHDADMVHSDTVKMLRLCSPGSVLLWHDFAPELVRVYPWIAEVCRGVERLIRERRVRGPILHLQDSWVGLYLVPSGEPPE